MKYLIILKRSAKHGGDIRLGFHSDSHSSAVIPNVCSSIRRILLKYSTLQLIERINKMRTGSATFKLDLLSQVISGGTMVKFDTGEEAAVEFTLLPSNGRFQCSTGKKYYREITVHQIKVGEGFENAPMKYLEPERMVESTTPNFETGGVSDIVDIIDPGRDIFVNSSGEGDLSWSHLAPRASLKNAIPKTEPVKCEKPKPQQSTNGNANGNGSRFDLLQSKPEQFTNGNFDVLRSKPQQFTNGNFDVLQSKPQQFTNGNFDVLQSKPEQFTNGNFDVLQSKPQQSTNGNFDVLQSKPQQSTNGNANRFGLLQSKPQQSTNDSGILTDFDNGTLQDLQVSSRYPIGLDFPNSTINSDLQSMNMQIVEKQLAIRKIELEYQNEQNIRAANNKQLELRLKSEELDCRKEGMKLKMQENAIKFINSLVEKGIPACEVQALLERAQY